jgi:dTDP-4-dehydrorhamnose 3,5-epimerase
MTFIETKVKGAWIIEPNVYEDDRGSFCETWNEFDFKTVLGIDHNFVQMNVSVSHENVLRGLHYQIEPYAQAKLVWVSNGIALDVFVDLRKDSPTYGQWDKVQLSSNGKRLYIPKGCAHGFVSKWKDTAFNYLVSDDWEPDAERTLIWNDLDLAIDWEIKDPFLSEKDKKGHTWKELKC